MERHNLSDGETVWLTAPLPHAGEIDVTGWDIRRITNGESTEIDASQVSVSHLRVAN